MWKAIKIRNLGADRVKEARLQTLITKFENLKMLDIGTTYEYDAKLSGIASKSVLIGKVISEHKLVKKFLTSLPIRFVHIVAALEQVLDLKTTGFEDVIGLLKAYEERIRQEDKVNDPRENLLYARTEYSNGNNDSSEGKGRGSYSRGRGRGRGQGRGWGNSQNQETIFMNEEKYTPPKSESNSDDEDDVWFRDGSCVSIKGKVLILFQGKRLDFVPSWGSLLIKVPHSANRLYKAQLKVSKEGTNEVGRESCTFTLLCNGIKESVTNQVIDEEVNPHSSSITINETNLEAGKGWKIHHLDVKKAFLSGDRKKLDSTLKEMGFYNACTKRRSIDWYRSLTRKGFRGDQTREICKEDFKRSWYGRLQCNFVSNGTGTQVFKSKTSFGIKYKRGNDVRLVGYNSHNVDIDDGRSNTGHVFYLGTSLITWFSQKQTPVALSSCEAEFIAATAAACQAIWRREVLAEVTGNEQVIVSMYSEKIKEQTR
nr:hypothetical protein [Tanacetum cinerariifolium]